VRERVSYLGVPFLDGIVGHLDTEAVFVPSEAFDAEARLGERFAHLFERRLDEVYARRERQGTLTSLREGFVVVDESGVTFERHSHS